MGDFPTAVYTRKEKRLLGVITSFYLFIFFIAFIDRFLIFFLLTGQEYFNPIDLPRKMNLIPFATIGKIRFFSMPVLGNILAFLPLGLFIKLYIPQIRKATCALFCFLLPAGIEAAQYLLATGSLDVDDYILNVCGLALGVLLYNAVFVATHRNTATVQTFFVNTALVFPPFLVSFIRCLLSDKRDAHLKWVDLAVHFVYLIAVFFMLRGAAKWQYVYIAAATFCFGVFFYMFFVAWV
ncbi:VanZ family protein [Allofournierella sp.]|uniref:VanZ family protein n=1 Tax=Allofournierella sp. TaxID=1940256 RepID=UPI003AB2C88C